MVTGDLLREIADGFRPAWFARSPHAQMIVSHAVFQKPQLGEETLLTVPLEDGEALAVLENLPAGKPVCGALLMHGLGGSAGAKYMLSATHRLKEAGVAVFRMNQRGAGTGAGLVRRLYHAGLCNDVADVLSFLHRRCPDLRIVPVGFSMSGNTLLKYLLQHPEPTEAVPGAVAMNPAVDLSRCVKAVERHANRFYHRRFAKLLVAQRTAVEPEESRAAVAERLASVRSIREFDKQITVPAWGFKDDEDYYQSQSVLPDLSRIRRKVVLITADDDPLVPAALFRETPLGPETALYVTRGGGHMGYLSGRKTPLGDRRFQDHFLVNAVLSLL